jgi:hypothetical protein
MLMLARSIVSVVACQFRSRAVLELEVLALLSLLKIRSEPLKAILRRTRNDSFLARFAGKFDIPK